MPFSADTPLRDIVNDREAAALLDKHLPGATSHPMLQQGLGMTLAQIAQVPEAGLAPATLKRLLADLSALDAARAAPTPDEG